MGQIIINTLHLLIARLLKFLILQVTIIGLDLFLKIRIICSAIHAINTTALVRLCQQQTTVGLHYHAVQFLAGRCPLTVVLDRDAHLIRPTARGRADQTRQVGHHQLVCRRRPIHQLRIRHHPDRIHPLLHQFRIHRNHLVRPDFRHVTTDTLLGYCIKTDIVTPILV